MPLVILKPGVSLKGIRPEMAMAHQTIVSIFFKRGYDCIVTSGTEGKHGKGSKHPSGNALDYRSKHIQTLQEKQEILAEIKAALGGTGTKSEYDCLLESIGKPYEHYHIEHDPPSWSITEG